MKQIIERIEIPDDMQPIIIAYYTDGAKRLYNMVDTILYRLKFMNIDRNDFYSLANEIFMYAIRDFDVGQSQSFDCFLRSCLYKKFCTEMTMRNREKRKADKMSVSIYTPIGDDENITIGDIIQSDFDLEKEVFKEREEDIYSQKMLKYLNRLSRLQKEILRLTIAGYAPNEIKGELHISDKQYADCNAALRSYRNISVLF